MAHDPTGRPRSTRLIGGDSAVSGKSLAGLGNGHFLSLRAPSGASIHPVASILIFLVFALQSPLGCAPKSGSPAPAPAPGSGSDSSALIEPGEDPFGEARSPAPVQPEPTVPPTPEWSIALVTITGEDHEAIARSSRRNILERFPELEDALFIGPLTRGSAVFYGRFDSPSEPGFRASMERIRGLTLGEGVPAFARALPARPRPAEPGRLDPYDLRTLREQMGDRHPIYTLQVAQWGSFGDDSIDYQALQREAERFTRALRAQGLDAWFSHSSGMRLSSVNVGVFGSDAYDSKSTLFAPEVELMLRRFPALVVNGEPLLDPRTGRSRVPFLVEIPR